MSYSYAFLFTKNIPIDVLTANENSSETRKRSKTTSNTATNKNATPLEVREDPLLLCKPEAKPRRRMRRSISFSEGTQNSPQKTPVKSGYNKHTSSKYDAIAAFDKPDMELTKKDVIQVFVKFYYSLLQLSFNLFLCVSVSLENLINFSEIYLSFGKIPFRFPCFFKFSLKMRLKLGGKKYFSMFLFKTFGLNFVYPGRLT